MAHATFLMPSKILYTHSCDPDICSRTENTFQEVTKTIQRGTVFPHLQVVKKDGFYFTLNDAKLQVYRHLEKLGKCGRVEVERVPIKEVPEGIRQLMKAPEQIRRHKDTKHKERGKYHSISASRVVTDDRALATDTAESEDEIIEVIDSSDYADTDSDFSDWSDEEPSATDIVSDGDNNNHSVDDNEDDDETHMDEQDSFI